MSWTNRIGLVILLIVFAWSLIKTNAISGRKDPDEIELGLGHWHLEGGWREGFDHFFREYEQLKAEDGVKVRMVDIPRTGMQSLYHVWVTSQLLGGTAPAMVSLGREPEEFIPRYYLPLDPYIRRPNPYNKGTELEGVPWRDTFQDNMQGVYNSKFLAYYGIPLSVLVWRVYYNVDLYNEIMYSFTPNQLADAAEIVSKLASGASADAPRHLQRIWVVLGKIRRPGPDGAEIDGQQAVRSMTGSPGLTGDQLRELAGLLNALLYREDLYDTSAFDAMRFTSMPGERETQQLLALRERHLSELAKGSSGKPPANEDGLQLWRKHKAIALNRRLLEAALGGAAAAADVQEPKGFEDWIAACQHIQQWADLTENRPRQVYPIAAIGTWTSSVLVNQYITATTANILRGLDMNRNGRTGTGFGMAKTDVEPEETFFAVTQDRVEFKNEYLITAYRMIEEVRKYFQPGFVAADWSTGKFQFGQGHAVMMPTGAWETKSLMKAAAEAKPAFEIGAFPFPIPAPDHPAFGDFVAGPVTEIGIPSTGEIGIYQGVSPEQIEYAIDFLQWFTSQKINERFMNDFTLWTPAIRGAKIENRLKPFAPNREGYRGGQAMQVGPGTGAFYGRLMGQWLGEEKTLMDFLNEYETEFLDKAVDDIQRQTLDPLRRQIGQIERELNRTQADIGGFSGEEQPQFDPVTREVLVLENQLNTIYDFSWMRDLNNRAKAKAR